MVRREHEERPPAPPPKEYTVAELEEFGRFLEPFRETKTLTNGEVVKVLNVKEAGSKVGAYKKVVQNFPPSEWKKEPYTVVNYNVILGSNYDEFNNKYDQWQKWRDKIEYVEGKKMEQYQEMVDTSNIGTRWKNPF